MSDDTAIVTTVVPADPDTTFELFTRDVDAWWRRGPRFRPALGPEGQLRFEPGVGGRFLEEYQEGAPFELGRVLAWDPGKRLAFEMGGRDFQPGETTEVEVRFESVAGGTRVSVTHRWSELRAGHPFAQGMEGEALVSAVGLFWADLLTSLRAWRG